MAKVVLVFKTILSASQLTVLLLLRCLVADEAVVQVDELSVLLITEELASDTLKDHLTFEVIVKVLFKSLFSDFKTLQGFFFKFLNQFQSIDHFFIVFLLW